MNHSHAAFEAIGKVALNEAAHQFKAQYFGTNAELFADAKAGRGNVLIVGCSDHCLSLEHPAFANPDCFFLVQNLAASIGATGKNDPALASIEYAIGYMNVKHAVVCGHAGCKIILDWLNTKQRCEQFAEASYFQSSTCRLLKEYYPRASSAERYELAVAEHVLVQLENLQSHPLVQPALESGQLQLHGWLVNERTSRIHCYSPIGGQFQ